MSSPFVTLSSVDLFHSHTNIIEHAPFLLHVMIFPLPSLVHFEYAISDYVNVYKSSGKGLRHKYYARGHILSLKNINFPGKFLIQYQDGSHYHVSPSRLFPVLSCPRPSLILTHSTLEYRHVSHLQIQKHDQVLEIGCDFGSTTAYLSSSCNEHIIGIDKCVEHIESAQKEYPTLTFHALDLFKEKELLKTICVQHNVSVMLLDINGNRPIEGVLAALDVIFSMALSSLQVVVVKSEELTGECLARYYSS